MTAASAQSHTQSQAVAHASAQAHRPARLGIAREPGRMDPPPPSDLQDLLAAAWPGALVALLLTATAGACFAAPAVTKADLAQAQLRYQQERAQCLAGQSAQDRSTCLKEAGAALAEARRGGLDSDPAQYQRNQQQRCDSLRGDEQADCLARMRGRGTTQGSVAGGGILRALVTREVMAPPPAAAATAPAASR